jgi:hypothetical protein
MQYRAVRHIHVKIYGRYTKNACHRVTQARKIIGTLNGVWWLNNITRNRKKMIYNSMVKSVLMY